MFHQTQCPNSVPLRSPIPSPRHPGSSEPRSPGAGPSLLRDRRGLSTVEYIIILLLIAVFSIGAWTTLGDSLRGRVKQSTGAIKDIQPESNEGK